MRYATLLLSGLLLCSHAALANRQPEPARMGNTDVVVDMPPEVWTQGQNRSRTTACSAVSMKTAATPKAPW